MHMHITHASHHTANVIAYPLDDRIENLAI